MTRRGDSNPEMLADLNATAAEAFTNALQQTLGPRMSPALEDKPLSALFVSFTDGKLDRFQGKPVVVAEELGVRPINSGDIEYLNLRHRFKDLPRDVIDRYQVIADRLGYVAVSPRLQVARYLPAEAIQLEYTEYNSNGTSRGVRTLHREPVKATIAAGQEFAEAALRYTESIDFNKPLPSSPAIPMGPHEHIVYSGGWQLGFQTRNITHHVGIDGSAPDLPLNGHESDEFLQGYLGAMLEKYESRQAGLKVLVEMGGYEAYYDQLREGMAPYERAIKLAKKVLERQKS